MLSSESVVLAVDALIAGGLGSFLPVGHALWGFGIFNVRNPTPEQHGFLMLWLGLLLWSLALSLVAFALCEARIAQLVGGMLPMSATLAAVLYRRDLLQSEFWIPVTAVGAAYALCHLALISRRVLQLARAAEGGRDERPMARVPLLPAAAEPPRAPAVAAAMPSADEGQQPLDATVLLQEALATAAEEEAAAKQARGYGTLQLLKIARPHRHWLYWGCTALLVRLPMSLSVPHFVAESIGALSYAANPVLCLY